MVLFARWREQSGCMNLRNGFLATLSMVKREGINGFRKCDKIMEKRKNEIVILFKCSGPAEIAN